MKVARVRKAPQPRLSSPFGIGGTTPQPALDDLSDVDTSGVTDGDTIVFDDATDTWVPGTGGGGGFPWWFNVEDYGAVHDGVTDDTVAIQDAIDACMTAGGGTVFFPNGVYAIKGALQSTSTYNSQLTIPQNALTGGLTQPPVSIRFLGMGSVAQSNNGASGAWLPSLSGAILLSDWNGSISGDPAVIAAGKVDAEYPAASFNWVQVSFENIEIRTHANPKLSAIQMRAAVTLQCTNVTVSTDTASAGMSLPSNSNAVGIDFPFGINSNPPDTLSNVFVDGYYWGIRTSEQTNGVGSVELSHCTKGIRFTGGVGTPTYIRHANVFEKILSVAVPTTLVFDGDERWVYIALLNVEHDSGTFAKVYDIDDASNYARGFIGWHTTDFSTGPEDGLTLNGGTGLSLHGGYAKRWKLNNVVDIPIGTNPSTNPANGRRLYTDSATGKLTGRTSAGATIDYEANLTPYALTVKDEGSTLDTAVTSFDFVGKGVVATNTSHAVTVTVAGSVPSGTSNPGSPTTGDLFNRTDLALLIRYDGSQWVTESIFEFTGVGANASANSDIGYFPPLGGTNIYLIDFRWTYSIAPTHSASHYWDVTLHKYEASGGTDTVVATLTSNQSSTIWTNPAPTSVNALLGTTIDLIYFTLAKHGSPSNINCGVTLRYRMVVT